VFHRTQDTATDRVAMSVRVAYSNTPVRRSMLAAGGLKKADMMRKNSWTYLRAFGVFDEAGRHELPLKAFVDRMNDPAKFPNHSRRFRNELLLQKARSGALISSGLKAFNEVVGRIAVGLYYQRRGKRLKWRSEAAARPATTP
jgi:hypothetical protein